MITKDGKIFGKINLFDFIALLLVVVLVFGVSYKFLFLNKSDNTVYVSYNLVVKNIRDVTVDSFVENKSIFDYKLDNNIGTITQIKKEQAKMVLKLLDGRVIDAPVDERYDMSIAVKAKAVKQGDGSLMVGKTKIIEGLELKVSTQKGNCLATIRDVK